MKLRTAALPCLMLGLASVSACKKQEAEPATPPPAAETSVATAPAAAVDPAQEEAARQAADKKAAIERALKEQTIVEDAKGQWAVSATASSTYSYDKSPTANLEYTAMKATGKPDVESYGDAGSSWTSEKSDGGIEWLELGFATPVNATELRIRQNFNPGAVVKLELIDEAGSRHTVWEGVDETVYPPSTTSWLVRSFEKTGYKAKGARITLATNAVPGWNEIDAVQLIGE